jgi:predicted lipoprotein with Yx(FWY)xxD motif
MTSRFCVPRPLRALLACTVAVLGLLTWTGSALARGHANDPNTAVVSVESSPYGQVLVVGGQGAGYVPGTSTTPASFAYPTGSSLYYPTIDPQAFGFFFDPGCTTVPFAGTTLLGPGPLSCTGSETDQTADWPAFTTDLPPVAGPGVNRWLLGIVYRPDLGTFQVTYAGHPLYLFVPAEFAPGGNPFFGANFVETVAPLPPWHTDWYLIARDGLPATGPAMLETQTPQPGITGYTSTVLSVDMLPGIGGVPITVYSFSRDTRWRSGCYGACARDFMPVLSDGRPTEGSGVNAGAVGVIRRFDGTYQVTYNGHPLYTYSQEQPITAPTSAGYGSAGNGNGVHAFGGTFTTVSP